MGKNNTPILIVDDQNICCSLMEILLKKKGYESKSVNNGFDAIEEVKKTQYDVIFLDVTMPGIDGLGTLKRIKKINKDQIVIMLTTIGDVDTITELLKEGADDYIQKPITDEELLRILTSAKEKRKIISERLTLHGLLKEK
jgi:DNA-binding NtrC family response regulator